MKALSPNQIACLLPVTILVHQLEEYYGQFPLWYSKLLNAQLSIQDFIIINGIGLFIFTAFALSYIFYKNNLILAALGTLVFVNGTIHLLLSVFTITYSPGTISGVVLFIPLGIIIYRKIFPKLGEGERIMAIAIGVIALFSVSLIAMNI
ncbi:MAG: HXXEE domain-containing protein [Maribacter sp.]|nr:HXXEE domain-containing protein [Maribacter sp.]